MRRWLCNFVLARTWPLAVFAPKAGIRGAIVIVLTLAGIASASAQGFTLTLQPNTIPAATENQAYSQVITAVGGNAPYTFAVTAGTLPAGITLATDGTLSGTLTVALSATNNVGATAFGARGDSDLPPHAARMTTHASGNTNETRVPFTSRSSTT